MWLLFPVGILTYLVGRMSVKKLPDVVAPEVVGAGENLRREREEADRKISEAEQERRLELDKVQQTYEEVLHELTDTQRSKAKELEADPERLNEFLLEVGTQIRK